MKFNRRDLVYGITEDFRKIIKGRIVTINNPSQHNCKRPFYVQCEDTGKIYKFNKADIFLRTNDN